MPSTYESRQSKKANALTERIRKLYEDAITDIVFQVTTFPFKGELFSLANFPAIEKIVNTELAKMRDKLYVAVVNGIKDSWNLANEKNDLLVDKRQAGRSPVPKVRQILYDPNIDALERFVSRKEKGLNLSDRVWKLTKTFKKELEQGLGIGIGKGQPAASMATELKRYLKEPDRLYRRVRGADGELYLSKAARDCNPGQGVYRSSFQNARRLTRSETNLAYRYSDHERWQKLPFVVGIEIKISNTHGIPDICDKLKGKYPKDFKFGGWHPACKCYQTSIQMTAEEYDKYEDSILSGGKVPEASVNAIGDAPASFYKYLEKEGKVIAGYKSKPYWMRDNKNYVSL